jgi:hypothetical protein
MLQGSNKLEEWDLTQPSQPSFQEKKAGIWSGGYSSTRFIAYAAVWTAIEIILVVVGAAVMRPFMPTAPHLGHAGLALIAAYSPGLGIPFIAMLGYMVVQVLTTGMPWEIFTALGLYVAIVLPVWYLCRIWKHDRRKVILATLIGLFLGYWVNWAVLLITVPLMVPSLTWAVIIPLIAYGMTVNYIIDAIFLPIVILAVGDRIYKFMR